MKSCLSLRPLRISEAREGLGQGTCQDLTLFIRTQGGRVARRRKRKKSKWGEAPGRKELNLQELKRPGGDRAKRAGEGGPGTEEPRYWLHPLPQAGDKSWFGRKEQS